jgi:hypothetical protein
VAARASCRGINPGGLVSHASDQLGAVHRGHASLLGTTAAAVGHGRSSIPVLQSSSHPDPPHSLLSLAFGGVGWSLSVRADRQKMRRAGLAVCPSLDEHRRAQLCDTRRSRRVPACVAAPGVAWRRGADRCIGKHRRLAEIVDREDSIPKLVGVGLA